MPQPKLSLKPTTAFELQNIGLFAISHPLPFFSVLFSHKCRIWDEGKGNEAGYTEFIVRIVRTYTVGWDMMQIQKFSWKSDKKGEHKPTVWLMQLMIHHQRPRQYSTNRKKDRKKEIKVFFFPTNHSCKYYY